MKRKKRAVTLIELMIVMLIIGLIGGVLAYNFKGSLDRGKKFKSDYGKEQVKTILELAVAEGQSLHYVVDNWQTIVRESALLNKPDDAIVDGWGKPYQVELVNGQISVNY